ncbi:Sickle tail protein -like protein [Triplophysa tibetana]|uniref:Sickle tail protein-like protein n=1 Tax=Triplophysa tibetana TaxID=1572043 RepID=A0A5A9N6L3_9TELE|nr:Sickle tail protein -like protein [Triplophysa tibetana]
MSKPSRLARPSPCAGSKLPSPRRDASGGRARIVSLGEKVMRMGGERDISVQRPPVHGTTHSQTHQNTNVKEQDEVAQPRSRMSKGSTATVTQQQVFEQIDSRPKVVGVNRQTPCHSCERLWNPANSWSQCPKGESIGTVLRFHLKSMEAQAKLGEASRTEEPLKGNLKVTSTEDTEHLSRKQQAVSANSQGNRCEPKSSRAGVSRRHTVGGARSSREILAMQPSDMDKKREAFLEHLKQKYPHHASAIMGHQERLREQGQGSKQSLASSSPVNLFGDHLEHGSLVSLDALEVMSECDAPIAFNRGSRSRASLPVVRSTNQTKDRSLGVLYLQYGDDSKQIRMPNEITSADTIKALFVSAFPHQLNMKMLESPSTAIYVKDENRNVYYELSDVR